MKLTDVKHAMAHKQNVRYKETEYYITACTMRIKGNEWYYQLELHDLKANAVTIASMEDIIYDLPTTSEGI